MLQGSTATVEVVGNKVHKHYHSNVSPASRKMEVENLEWAYEIGLPVAQLLSIKYRGDGDVIDSITTTFVPGYTLNELYDMGLVDLAEEAILLTRGYQTQAEKEGLYLPDLLLADGNIRVTLDGQVTLVDVGDSF